MTQSRDGADDLSPDERVRSRRRSGKFIIGGFLVLIVVIETVTFISRNHTAKQDARPTVYYGAAGSRGPNYVEIVARVIDISAASSTEQIRLTIVPHGSYESPGGGLAKPINLDADGYVGGTINIGGGAIPPPIQLTLDLNGELSQYPLDRYQSSLTVDLAPIQVLPGGGYTPPIHTEAVPTRLVELSTQHDWVTSSSLVRVWNDGSITINLTAHRGPATIGFAFFELFMMIALASIAVAMTYSAIVANKPLEFSVFVWLVAMLFALPAIRNTMPGVPTIGTEADFTVFFWCIIAVSGCLITAAITYIRDLNRQR